MVQRTVSVGLVANVSNYVANMNRAAEATRKTAAVAVGSEKQLRAQGEAYTKVGTAAIGAGALAAAGLAVVIKATADYGAKMAQLQSLSKASRSEMAALSKAAMEQGKAYGYSASQVADAEIELTKAGLTTQQILGGGLKSALALASAGQLDVGRATEISTIALTDFGLKASELPHVADLLAAGADKALGSVSDLGEGLANGGQQAHNMGLSIDDTVGTLSAFANAGIIGAEGGTQLRSMFIQLQKVTPQAQAVLDKYGISIYDTNGKFVGMSKLAGQLHDKLGDLTQAQQNAALATIFGSHAITGASVLMNLGAKNMQGWIDKVNDSGFANEQAAGKMDSLTGDVQKLSAALDTNLIKAGTGANDVLREFVQTGTSFLNTVGDMPPWLLNTGVALAVVTTGVGLFGGAALVAVPKMLLFEKTLAEAGFKATPFTSAMSRGKSAIGGLKGAAVSAASFLSGPWGLALAAGGAALDQYNQAVQNAQVSTGVLDAAAGRGSKGVDALVSSAAKSSNISTAVSSAISDWSTFGNVEKSITDDLKKNLDEIEHNNSFGVLGGTLNLFIPQAKGTQEAMGRVGDTLARLAASDAPQAAAAFQGIATQYKLTTREQGVLLSLMPSYQAALQEQATKTGQLTGKESDAQRQKILLALATKDVTSASSGAASAGNAQAAAAKVQATALSVLAGAANDGTVSVTDLKNAIAGLDGGQLSARDAARGFQQAIDDASAAAKKNGKTLDINTQAGRDNQAALDAVAGAAQKSAQAYLDASGTAAGAAKIVKSGRSAYIDAAVAMGMSRSAAIKLANSIIAIPKQPKIQVGIDGVDPAKAKLDELQKKLGNINGLRATVYVSAVANGVSAGRAGQIAKNAAQNAGFADGGAVTGPGPKGKDSVDAQLAPGEHVLTDKDVDAMGGQANVYRFRSALHMASGGAVSDAIAAQQSTASKAAAQIAKDSRAVSAAKRAAAAAQKREDALEKRYQSIDGTKANRAAKQAAKASYDAAKKHTAALEKQIDAASKRLEDAKQDREAANSATVSLRNDREDFVSQDRRGVTDPLSYVDQLRSMSRDSNFSQRSRTKFDQAANQYEAALVKLAKSSDDAAQKLSDLKDASKQMASSVTSSIAGRYASSNAASVQTTSGYTIRDGVSFSTTTSALSAASLDSYWQTAAIDTATFASQLQQLAKRGVNGQLLAEIAQDPNGPQLAAALLAANPSQLASISSNYAAVQGNAATAGQTVADFNYADLIEQAQTSADQITAEISADGEKLRKLIASAFGLKGYATGTPSATPGFHPVAENGAELVTGPGTRLFRGGERVYTAPETAFIRGGGTAAAAVRAQQVQVSMPSEMHLVDAGGQLISRLQVEARGVATQVFHSEMNAGAVRLIGA